MAILVDDTTTVLIQGITGQAGQFHTKQMIDYGTNIVGGVTPGKGGEWVHGKPIFDTVQAAVAATGAKSTVIFVKAAQATDAILEAINAKIPLIVCITEGIPVQDMAKIYEYIKHSDSYLLGPNSPGLIIPGKTKLGIIPGYIAIPGNIGIISKSGALAYEVIYSLTMNNIGQSACIGIGGDPIVGINLVDVLEMFENDPLTEKIILLGEIGGQAEIEAARYIKNNMTKFVAAYIAGKSAPEDTRMGHAGAIVEGGQGTAQEKISALQNVGVRIAHNPDQLASILST